jgi:hypothetical protein
LPELPLLEPPELPEPPLLPVLPLLVLIPPLLLLDDPSSPLPEEPLLLAVPLSLAFPPLRLLPHAEMTATETARTPAAMLLRGIMHSGYRLQASGYSPRSSKL